MQTPRGKVLGHRATLVPGVGRERGTAAAREGGGAGGTGDAAREKPATATPAPDRAAGVAG